MVEVAPPGAMAHRNEMGTTPPTLARSAQIILACALSLGCAPKHRPAAQPFEASSEARVDEIVKWETELTEDMPGLVGAFADRAQHYGCDILKYDPQAVVASCNGVPIAMAKSSRMVSVGCRGVTLEECRALFRRVVEAKGTDEGTTPPPATPPPPPGTSI
jgi:hypothetical protein